LEQYGDSPGENTEVNTEENEGLNLDFDTHTEVKVKTYSARPKTNNVFAPVKKTRKSRANKENSGPSTSDKSKSDLTSRRKINKPKEDEEYLNVESKPAARPRRKKPTRKAEADKDAEEWMKQKNLEFDSIDNFPLCVE